MTRDEILAADPASLYYSIGWAIARAKGSDETWHALRWGADKPCAHVADLIEASARVLGIWAESWRYYTSGGWRWQAQGCMTVLDDPERPDTSPRVGLPVGDAVASDPVRAHAEVRALALAARAKQARRRRAAPPATVASRPKKVAAPKVAAAPVKPDRKASAPRTRPG
jgi:hypothetical protein